MKRWEPERDCHHVTLAAASAISSEPNKGAILYIEPSNFSASHDLRLPLSPAILGDNLLMRGSPQRQRSL